MTSRSTRTRSTVYEETFFNRLFTVQKQSLRKWARDGLLATYVCVVVFFIIVIYSITITFAHNHDCPHQKNTSNMKSIYVKNIREKVQILGFKKNNPPCQFRFNCELVCQNLENSDQLSEALNFETDMWDICSYRISLTLTGFREKKLNKNWLQKDIDLVELTFGDSSLETIGPGVFTGSQFYTMETFTIERNKKPLIILNEIFETGSLKKLLIVESFIKKVENNSFKNLDTLETLILRSQTIRSDNVLKSILSNNFPQLLELDVQSSQLREITPEMFEGLPNLQALYLFSAGIETIHDFSFAKLQHLIALHLTSNRLKTVSENIFNKNKVTLFAKNNPWYCDCNLEWLKHYFETKPQLAPVCDSPEEFSNVSFLDVHFYCVDPPGNSTSSIAPTTTGETTSQGTSSVLTSEHTSSTTESEVVEQTTSITSKSTQSEHVTSELITESTITKTKSESTSSPTNSEPVKSTASTNYPTSESVTYTQYPITSELPSPSAVVTLTPVTISTAITNSESTSSPTNSEPVKSTASTKYPTSKSDTSTQYPMTSELPSSSTVITSTAITNSKSTSSSTKSEPVSTASTQHPSSESVTSSRYPITTSKSPSSNAIVTSTVSTTTLQNFPSCDFNITESVNSLEVVWSVDCNGEAMGVSIHSGSEDYHSFKVSNNYDQLSDNTCYVVCILAENNRIAPVVCKATKTLPKLEDRPWLVNKYKSLVYGSFVGLLFVLFVVGSATSFYLIRKNPRVLKGSGRVVLVKSNGVDALIMPEGYKTSSLENSKDNFSLASSSIYVVPTLPSANQFYNWKDSCYNYTIAPPLPPRNDDPYYSMASDRTSFRSYQSIDCTAFHYK